MALNFPAKIYQILENESNDIIRWHNSGVAFRIVDHDRFEREIIPKYFRHNQISSVQRQLNLYGFKCVSRGENKGVFYHPQFRRGDWEIVKKINRYVPVKKLAGPDIQVRTDAQAVRDTNDAEVERSLYEGSYGTQTTMTGTMGKDVLQSQMMTTIQSQDWPWGPAVTSYHQPSYMGTTPEFQSNKTSSLADRLGFKMESYPSAQQEQPLPEIPVLSMNTSMNAPTQKQQQHRNSSVYVDHRNVVTVNPDSDLIFDLGLIEDFDQAEQGTTMYNGLARKDDAMKKPAKTFADIGVNTVISQAHGMDIFDPLWT